MSPWPLAKIGQLTTKVGSGATPLGGETAYKVTGTPLIRSMNVHFVGFKRDGLAFLDDQQAKALDNAIVKADDVLLNITGASIGRVTWAPADLDGARVNQHVCIIRPRDALEPRFLAHFLASPPQQRRIMNEQVGATRQGLTKGRILEFEVPVPPLPEQRRIVAKIEELFSDLDAGVASLKRVKANLKRYRASVLKAAVEGRLTEEWRKRNPSTEPASKLLERILAERRAKWEADQLRRLAEAGKQPQKGWKEQYRDAAAPDSSAQIVLPGGWLIASTDALLSFVTSGSRGWAEHYSDSGALFIRVGNLNRTSISLDLRKIQRVTPPKSAESARTVLSGGDLLISVTADIGMVAVTPDGLGVAYVNQHIALARPLTTINKQFLAWYLATDHGGQAQWKRLQRGATKLGLGLDDIRHVAVPLPPFAEQAEIVAEIDRRLSVADAVEAEVEHGLKRAARLRQSILKRAFEGSLVPQDPADEPASALLDRLARQSKRPRAVEAPQRRKGVVKSDRRVLRTKA